MATLEPGGEKPLTGVIQDGATPKGRKDTMKVVDQYRMTGGIDIKQIARALRDEEETTNKWKMVSGILFVSLMACFLLTIAASALAFHVMKDTELANEEVGTAQTAARRRSTDSTGIKVQVDREGNKVYCSAHPDSLAQVEAPEMDDVDEVSKHDFLDSNYWKDATFCDSEEECCVVKSVQYGGAANETVTLACTTGDTKTIQYSEVQRRRQEQVVADWSAVPDARRRQTFANWNNVDSLNYATMSTRKIKQVCARQWMPKTGWTKKSVLGFRRCWKEIKSRRNDGRPMLLMRDAIIGVGGGC